MDCKSNLFDIESLIFFGRVNASISHELKNILAIISETAGLLTDLSEMAKSGRPIELDMLTESTQSIVEEIQRGFMTIRQMNRFSHSVDNPIVSVNLEDILDLISHLSGYLAFAGKMQMHPVEGDTPTVLTYPFILQTIIYEATVQIFKSAGPKAKLDVFIQSENDSAWQIIFKGADMKKLDAFPNDQIKHIATLIGVSINCHSSEDHLVIQVPASTEAITIRSVGSEA